MKATAVVVKEEQIYAYVELNEPEKKTQRLEEQLAKHLLGYFPALQCEVKFSFVNSLPLNHTGKIDRSLLKNINELKSDDYDTKCGKE